MSNKKHTPGPWKVDDLWVDDLWKDDVVDTKGSLVVSAYGDYENPTTQANARLISAAPELLETVVAYRLHHKLMLQIADDTDCPCTICKMAEAAISKAKGVIPVHSHEEKVNKF